tara:strand:- start:152 stop:307 length:156 start_codon:yes stop_codon:yes gene_type:complete
VVPRAEVFVRIGWWSVPLLAGVRGSVDETFSPVQFASNVQFTQAKAPGQTA